MTSMKEVVQALRNNADHLESIARGLVAPDFSGTDIRAAQITMESAFPETAFNFQPPHICFSYSGRRKVTVDDKWVVGVHHRDKAYTTYSGNTLADAVNAALATLQPPDPDPVATMQAALTPDSF